MSKKDEAAERSQRGAERTSAQAYADAGIWGAPGSEVPENAETPPVIAGARPASQVEAEDGVPDETAAEEA